MSGQTIVIEVPGTLAGVRVDRGVAMVADVSRQVAAELVSGGRVLVDDAVVLGPLCVASAVGLSARRQLHEGPSAQAMSHNGGCQQLPDRRLVGDAHDRQVS